MSAGAALRFGLLAALVGWPGAAPAQEAALIAAARRAPVCVIDYQETFCDGGRRIDRWLANLTNGVARRVRWSAGRCLLANPLIPADAGSRWCAQARILLIHPRQADDRPMIEVYFEQPPRHGRPTQPYAFRGAMLTVDGADTMRRRTEFEAAWRGRFPAAGLPACQQQPGG